MSGPCVYRQASSFKPHMWLVLCMSLLFILLFGIAASTDNQGMNAECNHRWTQGPTESQTQQISIL